MLSNFVLLLGVMIMFISYFAFVLPRKDKMIFKLYQKRDELTLYAMNTPGKQDTEEYKYVVQMINIEIYLIKNNISFMDYYRSVIERTVENEKEIEGILDKIKQDEFMKDIFEESFAIFEKYFNKKFKWFKWIFLVPLVRILDICLRIFNAVEKAQASASSRNVNRALTKTENITENYERYIRMNSNAM